MVFSQTSHKTQSILKVVDIDRLKPNKDQQENSHGLTGSTGGGGYTEMMPSWLLPTTSCLSEEFLKEEPVYDSTMFHDTDSEFFQDLVQWCSDPAKEEQAPIIDSMKIIEERAHKNNNLHTPFSPQGWEAFDANSPTASTGIYCSTPSDPLSPREGFGQLPKLPSPGAFNDPHKMQYQEDFFDFNNMPIVYGDLEPEKVAQANAIQTTGFDGWGNYINTNNNILTLNTHTQDTMPLIETEESKLSVIPRELESNDVIITEVIFGPSGVEGGIGPVGPVGPVGPAAGTAGRRGGLTVNIPARVAGWPADFISTPDIVSCVEQLENENTTILPSTPVDWPVEDTRFVATDVSSLDVKTSPQMDYEPITPKSESQAESEDEKSHSSKGKRRYESEDSDETYTPFQETAPKRKYTRRKPNVPIKDMIKALEGSQPLKKAKRGRPPKRRDSAVSSVCSVDDNTNGSNNHKSKYRDLRDKNNEASKRSRMNRKLRELQIEQLALDLEEKNKKLKIKADILEDMTKRLKEALMTAILQKK